MPELPEVETVRKILDSIVAGETIINIQIYRKKNILNDDSNFVSSLIGETFLNVTRKGKFLLFHLTNGKAIISHLRMEGKYYEGNCLEEKFPHDILRYEFKDGKTLRYNDVRTFGTIEFRLEKDLWNNPPLNSIAKDPFEISFKEFASALTKCHRPIKEAIMDQRIISGIGNIYADEILFASMINPLKKADTLTEKESRTIFNESQWILTLAIQKGGSTIKSYHPKEGIDGNMQNELLAYGKAKKPCPRCSFPLKRIVINGRGTTYCPLCQKSDGPIIVGVTGPIASGKSEVSRYLEEKGYDHIDADAIVSILYTKRTVLSSIAKIFGNEAVLNGAINRDYLRKKIAEENELKKRLERYIWPKVYQEIEKRIKTSKTSRILLDVPFLISSPLEKKCDLIIYIEANKEKQIERILKRGKDPLSSLKMNSSFPRTKAKKAASIILDGNGSVASLRKQLASLTYL